MPPGKRSSSSHHSSSHVSRHSSSSHLGSGGVNHHSSSSQSSLGSVRPHSSSSHHSSGSRWGNRAYGSQDESNGHVSGFHNITVNAQVQESSSSKAQNQIPERQRSVKGNPSPHTAAKGRRTSAIPNYGELYGSGGIRTYLSKHPDTAIILERIIKNQPPGYPYENKSYPCVEKFHCVGHDYLYYGSDWTYKRKRYLKGYYDEEGTYHPDLFLQGRKEVRIVTCRYCENEVKVEGNQKAEEMICPSCGAQMSYDDVDELIEVKRYRPDPPKPLLNDLTRNVVLGVGTAACLVIAGVFIREKLRSPQPPEQIYVKEIERTCSWLSYDEGYYDPVTDCYFLYNDNIEYPQWQYWYEGISSDYEESGWMEYDEGKEKWFIEEREDRWIELPEKYLREELWHIEDEE